MHNDGCVFSNLKLLARSAILSYMKYATAAYGDAMIRAAEMDVLGKFDNRLSSVDKISEHCSIPEEDIVLMDIDYGGDVSNFVLIYFSIDRHFSHFLFCQSSDQSPPSFCRHRS